MLTAPYCSWFFMCPISPKFKDFDFFPNICIHATEIYAMIMRSCILLNRVAYL